MEKTQSLPLDIYEPVAWSALFIWWGVVMLIDPLTIGIGAVGAGLILLSLNGARSLKGIPARRSTTEVGIMALLWGAVDAVFNPSFELSFAILLIVIGLTWLGSLVARSRAE